MVNSKKMSKSTIAVIALSILLVLSLILTATGAWFTDQKSGSDTGTTKNFGIVVINLDDTAAGTLTQKGIANNAAIEEVVADTVYTAVWTVTNTGSEDVYFKISASEIHLYVDDVEMNAAAQTAADISYTYQIETATDGVFETVAVGVYDANHVLRVGESRDIKVVITFGEGLPNEIAAVTTGESAAQHPAFVFNTKDDDNSVTHAEFKVTYSLTIDAIQYANYADHLGA